tara:strand:+ start:165 stop:392 length:228 start_codon:yes stop_codon:yes gene_type:complete
MLNKYIDQSDDSWVSEKAALAVLLESMYYEDELTQADYKELLEDIVRTDAIADQSNTTQLKSDFITALNAITMIL